MDAKLTAAPLPSISCLTGSIPPNSPELRLDERLGDLTRQQTQKWLSTPCTGTRYCLVDTQKRKATPRAATPQASLQVGSLSDTAQRHLTAMSRAPGTPYQRTLTHSEKDAMKKPVKRLAESFQASLESEEKCEGKAAAGEVDQPWANALSPRSPRVQALSGLVTSRLGTPAHSRPSTSMSVTDFNMPRPSSKLTRLRGLPGENTSASWSGPISELKTKELSEEGMPPITTRLDPNNRGYITLDSWRDQGANAENITNFTRLYLQKTKGKERAERSMKQVRSLYMAMQMVLTKLQLKSMGKSIPYRRLLDAFTFMDADGSGSLDTFEVQDAFHGLGINITPEVADEAMRNFDKDGDGTIDYHEFGKTLFPNSLM
eukprot:gene1825-33244_t